MGNQSSLRGYELVVSGDGILVPGAPLRLSLLSGHGGKNQGVGEMQGGRGGRWWSGEARMLHRMQAKKP